jgi:hypothetical protein
MVRQNDGEMSMENDTGREFAGQSEASKSLSDEQHLAFTLAELFRKLLRPDEQDELAKSLTHGPKIESSTGKAVLYLASETVRALPAEHWNSVAAVLQNRLRDC